MALAMLLALLPLWARPQSPLRLALHAGDRVMILSPHPDDDVLGCGGLIQQAVSMGLPLRVVYLTYGDSNEWSFVVYSKRPVVRPAAIERMGMVRHDEAVAAEARLGAKAVDLHFLGYPDHGTLDIWSHHWRDEPPLRALLTRATSVPYASAKRRGAPYKGEDILADLTAEIKSFQPTRIFVTHPYDTNPDHRAFYLFAQVARWDAGSAAQLWTYLVHFPSWPPADKQLSRPPGAWKMSPLSPLQVERKRQALRCHRTQMSYSASYLLSFVRSNEWFTELPDARSQMTDIEHARLLGTERRSVQRSGSQLKVSVALSRPLAHEATVTLSLFGWRHDRPFADMPKLRCRISALGCTVHDLGRRRPAWPVETNAHAVTVQVPLRDLGDPQKLFFHAETFLGEVRQDSLGWQIVDL